MLDFGVAKLRDSGDEAATTAGMIIGTPHYMAPEQALGKEVDRHADVWAAGVVLYELLSGAVPFSARSFVELAVASASGAEAAPTEDAARRADPGVAPGDRGAVPREASGGPLPLDGGARGGAPRGARRRARVGLARGARSGGSPRSRSGPPVAVAVGLGLRSGSRGEGAPASIALGSVRTRRPRRGSSAPLRPARRPRDRAPRADGAPAPPAPAPRPTVELLLRSTPPGARGGPPRHRRAARRDAAAGRTSRGGRRRSGSR